jgi:phosphoribosylaminoimidazole-succinocarboxamide synthase
MKENQKFDKPILTPTTKAHEGHDEDISREEIIKQGLVSETEYIQLEDYTRKLFQRGTDIAHEKGLILVDTKYEFGVKKGNIYLIDEIHTPDSSRYFYEETYQDNFDQGENQKHLSKEFVRQWLIDNGFQGKKDQAMPEMHETTIKNVSDRYIELFESITGDKFEKADAEDVEKRIENNILQFLNQ